jgi:hypothetical protein
VNIRVLGGTRGAGMPGSRQPGKFPSHSPLFLPRSTTQQGSAETHGEIGIRPQASPYTPMAVDKQWPANMPGCVVGQLQGQKPAGAEVCRCERRMALVGLERC